MKCNFYTGTTEWFFRVVGNRACWFRFLVFVNGSWCFY